jgi:ribonuclease HII
VSTFTTGRRAEAAAIAFLEYKGCTIVTQNWRTRWCEIDIIACRDTIVYLCEVKYRRNNRYGDGLDYITPQKLRQMHFAAEVWAAAHGWNGQMQLCAIAVTGPQFQVHQAVKIAL